MGTDGYSFTGHDARLAGMTSTRHGTETVIKRSQRKAYVKQLRQFAVFRNCTPDDLDALLGICTEFTYPARWPMMAQDTPADACFVVLDGQVDVFIGGSRIAGIGPGELVGEMAMVTGQLRRATVTTATRVSGLRAEILPLRQLLQARPSLLAALRAEFDQRAAERSSAGDSR